MDEQKVLENNPLNLRSSNFKIKEEITNFDPDTENLEVLAEEGSSPFALSYGEVFIIEKQDGGPFSWWIDCNVCPHRFNNFETFLDHVTNTHLNKQTNENLKTEIEHFYNDNANNINAENKCFDDPPSNKSYDESDSEYKVDPCDAEDSDSDESFMETLEENKDIIKMTDDVELEENVKKKGLLPRHCEKCNRTFKKPSTLRRHLNVHMKKDNKTYECKICHEKFSKEQKRLYRNHRERAHKEKIPCLLCDKSFGSKFYLESHMKTHTGTKDFKCNRCSAAFYSKTSLSGHIRKTHLTPKVPCKYCKKLFRPGSCLEIHERIHTGEKPFICEQCGTAFQTNSLLQNHIKRHNNDRRFECDICGKKFFNHTYLRDHKVTHTDEKPYGCDICNARFNSGPALRKHKNLHSGIKKYQCKICGKSYAQSPGLYAHMKSHNIAEDKNINIPVLAIEPIEAISVSCIMFCSPGIKCGDIYCIDDVFTYNCLFCNKNISDIDEFQTHYTQKHKLSDIKFDVDLLSKSSHILQNSSADELKSSFSSTLLDLECEKKDEFQEVLKANEELVCPEEESKEEIYSNNGSDISSGTESFRVSQCEKSENDQEVLTELKSEKDDIKTDIGKVEENVLSEETEQVNRGRKKVTKKEKQKEFPCEICGRIYQRPKKLKAHMEIHTPGFLTCPDCGKVLKTKVNLKSHMRIHTGDGFSCNVCDAKFPRRGSLTQHMLRHQNPNERRYACEYENCDFRFVTSSALRAHELTHTGEKPLVCEFCGRSFRNITALKEHIKRHTNQRDFKCSHCEKKFFDKKALKDHEVGHIGVKNFVCNICSVYFLRKKSLRCHMKKHSGIRNYKCKICGESFALYNDISYHMKKKHGVQSISTKT
ncbi:zinc finger protein 845-like [Condylostylus longicornis]|uniref:zinc finger protein 845-like n=1 Tax=Condylostylus longicornis TaxID=2530218 RepID=UPI00244DC0B8|nr:zinc finger protein 845-like [Condylostylus longicornis]